MSSPSDYSSRFGFGPARRQTFDEAYAEATTDEQRAKLVARRIEGKEPGAWVVPVSMSARASDMRDATSWAMRCRADLAVDVGGGHTTRVSHILAGHEQEQRIMGLVDSMNAWTIALDHRQYGAALCLGAQRYTESLAAGRRDRAGGKTIERGLAIHAMGALGECALAVKLGQFDRWAANAVGDPAARDVDPYEVRTAPPNGCLILKERERHPDAPTVLAIVDGSYPSFARFVLLAGWCWPDDVRTPDFWRTDVPSPAYFVPKSALQPMDSMRREVGCPW